MTDAKRACVSLLRLSIVILCCRFPPTSQQFGGQIVPIANHAPLSAKLLKQSTLQVYKTLPHGMCTTHAEVVNPDLLAFVAGTPSQT
jgi:hypothetical protein